MGSEHHTFLKEIREDDDSGSAMVCASLSEEDSGYFNRGLPKTRPRRVKLLKPSAEALGSQPKYWEASRLKPAADVALRAESISGRRVNPALRPNEEMASAPAEEPNSQEGT
jgi:hypothetical protein